MKDSQFWFFAVLLLMIALKQPGIDWADRLLIGAALLVKFACDMAAYARAANSPDEREVNVEVTITGAGS